MASDEVYEIHDYKTGNSLPSRERFEQDRQLALYSYAIKRTYGFDKEVKLIWHYLAYNKEIHSTRTNEQLEKKQWNIACPDCRKELTPVGTKETKPLSNSSIYAITKKNQEEMTLNIGEAYGIPSVALRFFNVYGPRQSLSNPYTGVAAIFMSRIKNGSPPIIFEDGLQSRDFVSVHDIAAANMLAMKSRAADYGIFNVGTGRPVTIMAVAEAIARIYGKSIKPTVTNNYRKGDVRHCFADISRIKSRLGFEPKVSFEDGMRELISWADKASAVDMVDKATTELKSKGLVG